MFDWSKFVCQVAGKEALVDAKKGRVGLDALSIIGLQKRATNELPEYRLDSVDKVARGFEERWGARILLYSIELSCG